jgi:hypothetical protein
MGGRDAVPATETRLIIPYPEILLLLPYLTITDSTRCSNGIEVSLQRVAGRARHSFYDSHHTAF